MCDRPIARNLMSYLLSDAAHLTKSQLAQEEEEKHEEINYFQELAPRHACV